jgi:glutathione S-transferase
MLLYMHPASPNARAARIVCRELSVCVEERVVQLNRAEQKSSASRNLNPNGCIPVLVDEDFVVWEASAILHYLADTAQCRALCAANARERADILRWQFWSQQHWVPVLQAFIQENVFRQVDGHGEPDIRRLALLAPSLHQAATVLEDHLASRTWLVGERLSLADISVAVHLMYAEAARMPITTYENVQRWYTQVRSLDGWRQTEPDGQTSSGH